MRSWQLNWPVRLPRDLTSSSPPAPSLCPPLILHSDYLTPMSAAPVLAKENLLCSGSLQGSPCGNMTPQLLGGGSLLCSIWSWNLGSAVFVPIFPATSRDRVTVATPTVNPLSPFNTEATELGNHLPKAYSEVALDKAPEIRLRSLSSASAAVMDPLSHSSGPRCYSAAVPFKDSAPSCPTGQLIFSFLRHAFSFSPN